MLIKFDSDAGSFTMNGDVAVQLLRAMGHSGTVPSALLAKDIPAALSRLRAAVGAGELEKARDDEEDLVDVPVSLRLRAFPLVELLARAVERNAEITWMRQA
ncbi:MAG TPA: DUF1840 domain-containing protein [Burkholderiales bacterium]|nr:DUF1840 domain-containing protein [Burkholderiales bacterium]